MSTFELKRLISKILHFQARGGANSVHVRPDVPRSIIAYSVPEFPQDARDWHFLSSERGRAVIVGTPKVFCFYHVDGTGTLG